MVFFLGSNGPAKSQPGNPRFWYFLRRDAGQQGTGSPGHRHTYPEDTCLRAQAFGAHLHDRVGAEGDAGLVLAHS